MLSRRGRSPCPAGGGGTAGGRGGASRSGGCAAGRLRSHCKAQRQPAAAGESGPLAPDIGAAALPSERQRQRQRAAALTASSSSSSSTLAAAAGAAAPPAAGAAAAPPPPPPPAQQTGGGHTQVRRRPLLRPGALIAAPRPAACTPPSTRPPAVAIGLPAGSDAAPALPATMKGPPTGADREDELLDGLLLSQLGEEAGPVGLDLDARRLHDGVDVVGLRRGEARGALSACLPMPCPWPSPPSRPLIPAACSTPQAPGLLHAAPHSSAPLQPRAATHGDIDAIVGEDERRVDARKLGLGHGCCCVET